MDQSFRKQLAPKGAGASPPSEARLFAQALLGKPVASPFRAEADARAKREQLEWLAQFSTEHESQLRSLLRQEAEARRKREQLAWLAQISTEHERKLRRLLGEEAEARERHERSKRLAEAWTVQEAQWDPADHPRKGYPPDGGQWVKKGGAGGPSGTETSPSFLDAVIRRNQTIAGLAGVVTPGMIRSNGIATELQAAGEVARAAAACLRTGRKAVVNGFATAVKSVATLGLSTSQLELIGVTKEDRARGYDTAVSISTASGQVLIAVGTGGMASALSKGGSIVRTASGALLAFDAAGNAVGVVQGLYDATQNGVSVANGTQMAGGLLGLSANVGAAKSLTTPRAQPQAPNILFRVGKHAEMPTPRPGQQSHHGVMSAWMEKVYSSYDANKAPAILMPEANHRATYRVFNKWKAEMAQKMGGTFNWSNVSEADMRALSVKMFDGAQVPSSVRRQYWTEFEKMKSALQK